MDVTRAELRVRAAAVACDELHVDTCTVSTADLLAVLDELANLRGQVEGADRFQRDLCEALNSGGGVYRP